MSTEKFIISLWYFLALSVHVGGNVIIAIMNCQKYIPRNNNRNNNKNVAHSKRLAGKYDYMFRREIELLALISKNDLCFVDIEANPKTVYNSRQGSIYVVFVSRIAKRRRSILLLLSVVHVRSRWWKFRVFFAFLGYICSWILKRSIEFWN
jgi:hypothetical protein